MTTNIDKYIKAYDNLIAKRECLLRQKSDIDDIIRAINIDIKKLDFKFYALQQVQGNEKLDKDLTQRGSQDE